MYFTHGSLQHRLESSPSCGDVMCTTSQKRHRTKEPLMRAAKCEMIKCGIGIFCLTETILSQLHV